MRPWSRTSQLDFYVVVRKNKRDDPGKLHLSSLGSMLIMEAPRNLEGAHATKDGVEAVNKEVGEQASNSKLQIDIARSVLGVFGLRPFHIFDGERYHVCFGVAEEKVTELNYNKEHLDEFFSNCCESPKTSDAHVDHANVSELQPALLLSPVPATAPAAAKENGQDVQAKISPPGPAKEDGKNMQTKVSPKEVYYIMEEHYLSPTLSPTPKNTYPPGEEHQDCPAPPVLKEIHFVMENHYLSPEELRLQLCFPSLVSPPSASSPKDAPMDECRSAPGPGNLDHLNDFEDQDNGADEEEVSTRSNAGKVRDEKVTRTKRKNRNLADDYDASQSVRLDKICTVPAVPRRATKKVPDHPQEPPGNELALTDLEEQIGDSWVDEKFLSLPDENPGDVVNPGQNRKSFWPTPLYGSPRPQVRVGAGCPDKNYHSSNMACSEEESSEVEDFEECLEQSKKKEEVALAKYALLFKDDQSWRKKFLDGFKLTCDICFSKRKIKKFSSVMALLAHAKTVKKLRQPEHRGYAQAIRNLLHLDDPGSIPACQSSTGSRRYQIEGVWPPVVIVENTLMGVDFNGDYVGLNSDELSQMLKVLGDHGTRKLHPIVGEDGLTGQVLVEFPASHRGWIDAKHMHHQFELHARSYEEWLRLKPKYKTLLCDPPDVQESNGLVMVLKDGSTAKRILYGYLATPRIIKYIDPNKYYVGWEVDDLKEFFDISDSECSQAVQM